jgi:hypothetical protein
VLAVRRWVADGLAIVGGLTSVAGAIRATFAYVHYFQGAPYDGRGRAIAGLEFADSVAVAGVITGEGIAVLVLSLVIGYGIQTWTSSLPLGLTAGALVTTALAHRMLAQLRAR